MARAESDGVREGIPLLPDTASTIARSVDLLYFFIVGVVVFFALLIFVLLFYFAIKYRRRTEDQLAEVVPGAMGFEVFWTAVPLFVGLVCFGWGASLYFVNSRPPDNAMDIHVVGKQWMWKLQHPEGQREINELHVPVGRPVRLIMTSEDVLHSFYVPDFRVKMDVLPGRYTTVWFQATKAGEFHLFCTEYCGNEHSLMRGKIVAMEPADYQRWLSGAAAGETMAEVGERLFHQLRCDNCHISEATGRGPSLEGVFGTTRELASGESVLVDEAYLRESILNPRQKLVPGYRPLMPTFQGKLTEDEVLQLIAFLKELGE